MVMAPGSTAPRPPGGEAGAEPPRILAVRQRYRPRGRAYRMPVECSSCKSENGRFLFRFLRGVLQTSAIRPTPRARRGPNRKAERNCNCGRRPADRTAKIGGRVEWGATPSPFSTRRSSDGKPQLAPRSSIRSAACGSTPPRAGRQFWSTAGQTYYFLLPGLWDQVSGRPRNTSCGPRPFGPCPHRKTLAVGAEPPAQSARYNLPMCPEVGEFPRPGPCPPSLRDGPRTGPHGGRDNDWRPGPFCFRAPRRRGNPERCRCFAAMGGTTGWPNPPATGCTGPGRRRAAQFVLSTSGRALGAVGRSSCGAGPRPLRTGRLNMFHANSPLGVGRGLATKRGSAGVGS